MNTGSCGIGRRMGHQFTCVAFLILLVSLIDPPASLTQSGFLQRSCLSDDISENYQILFWRLQNGFSTEDSAGFRTDLRGLVQEAERRSLALETAAAELRAALPYRSEGWKEDSVELEALVQVGGAVRAIGSDTDSVESEAALMSPVSDLEIDTIRFVALARSGKTLKNCSACFDPVTGQEVLHIHWRAVVVLAYVEQPDTSRWAYLVAYQSTRQPGFWTSYSFAHVNQESIEWLEGEPSPSSLDAFIRRQVVPHNLIIPTEEHPGLPQPDSVPYVSFDRLEICRDALEEFVGGIPSSLAIAE